MHVRDVVSWDSVTSGFVECGDMGIAVKVLMKCLREEWFHAIINGVFWVG